MKKLLFFFFSGVSFCLQAQINQTEICKIAVDLQLMKYKVYIDNANTDATVDSIEIFRYINNAPTSVGKIHKDSSVFVDNSFAIDSLQMNNQTIKYTLKETYTNSSNNSLATYASSHTSLAFHVSQDSIKITREYEVNDNPISVTNAYGFEDKYYLAVSFKTSPFGQVDTILGPYYSFEIGTYGVGTFVSFTDTSYYSYIYVYPEKNCQGMGNKSQSIDLMAFVNIVDYINNPNLDTSAPGDVLSTQNSIIEKLEIFPNPSTDFINLNIHLKTSENINASVLDMQGRKLISYNLDNLGLSNSYQIPVSGLSPGVYFLTLQTQKEIVTKKFIVR